jgi:hypothetical protein
MISNWKIRKQDSRTIQVFVFVQGISQSQETCWRRMALVNETLGRARIANKLRHYNLEAAS